MCLFFWTPCLSAIIHAPLPHSITLSYHCISHNITLSLYLTLYHSIVYLYQPHYYSSFFVELLLRPQHPAGGRRRYCLPHCTLLGGGRCYCLPLCTLHGEGAATPFPPAYACMLLPTSSNCYRCQCRNATACLLPPTIACLPLPACYRPLVPACYCLPMSIGSWVRRALILPACLLLPACY